MKNSNFNFARVNIISIAIMTIALGCAVVSENVEQRMVASGVAVLLLSGLYITLVVIRKRDFSDLAIAQLEKAGLSCKRKDDGIVVKQGDFIMNAKLWNNNVHGLKRVHFMFDFAPDVINDVLPEGWALLAAECNANFDHTMVKFYGDHFSCMVETSVKSAKEFLDEYRFAFDKIFETIQGMEANAPRVVKQFPVKKRQIGFLMSDHQ